MRLIFISISILFSTIISAQFAPYAGQAGTTAISKDSSIIINWASVVYSFNPGPEDISNSQSPLASFGSSNNALGEAEGTSTDVISLGDGGSITLTFPYPIINGAGPDFAIFENGFDHFYLEFAFVEVSSNGLDFVRFPATSLTQTINQTGGLAYSDPTKFNNLAGKYKQGYGTPFDLQDLQDSTGINLDSIQFIKVIDVVGSVNPNYGSNDAQNNLINDPFPTPFPSSGFDLDGIGVIHQNNPLFISEKLKPVITLYPNPARSHFMVKMDSHTELFIFDLSGNLLLKGRSNQKIETNRLTNGIYFIKINTRHSTDVLKLIVHH